MKTGDLPTRESVAGQPSVVKAMDASLPGDSPSLRREPDRGQAGSAADHHVPEDLHGPRQHDRLRPARPEPAAGGPSPPPPLRSTRTWQADVSVSAAHAYQRGRPGRGGPQPGRPHSRRPGGLRRMLSSEHFTGWAFVTPGVVIIVLFGAVPIVWSAVMSFQSDNLLSPSTPFVGTANYRELLHDPVRDAGDPAHADLHRAVRARDDAGPGWSSPVAMNRKIRFISFYRTAAYLRDDGDLHDPARRSSSSGCSTRRTGSSTTSSA